jgi:hypothetical protein
LQDTIDTGIVLGGLLPGMVPLFEEREASCQSNYTWKAWQRLTGEERAEAVAHYRIKLILNLHRDDAMNKEMKRRNRRVNNGT